jgi:Protein of unknown function (DUF1566)
MNLRIPLIVPFGALLGACNSLLGISEPYDEVLAEEIDAGGRHDAATGSLGGATADAGSASVRDGAANDAYVVVPTAYAYAWWPMPSRAEESLPAPQDYDTSVEGLVLDRVTGLTWQRVVEESGLTAAEAATYCEQLDIGGGGFRLPTRMELSSILDVWNESPAIDTSAFPETLPDKHWTSSPYADGPSFAWVVHFGFSTSHVLAEPVDQPHPVRCVRVDDTEPLTGTPPRETSDDLVTDELTGLTWQRAVSSASMTFPDAVAACAALDLSGSGFRLPTLREFQTVVNGARTSPSVDEQAFPDTPPTLFWTQTPVAGFPEYAWAVSFTDGSDMWLSKPSAARVRCVRNVL